jgi:hypothetical protein
VVDGKDSLTPSPVNDHYIETVRMAFFMQKILDFSWCVWNYDLFHILKSTPPNVKFCFDLKNLLPGQTVL